MIDFAVVAPIHRNPFHRSQWNMTDSHLFSKAAASHFRYAGYYDREVRASLAGVWENVLDFEHLAWLHASSFHSLEPFDRGAWERCEQVGVRTRSRGSGYGLSSVSTAELDTTSPEPWKAQEREPRFGQSSPRLRRYAPRYMLCPQDRAAVVDGRARYPWHGYRFDVRMGAACGGRRPSR